MKIKAAQLHDLIRQVSKGLMSFSRMVEILNETAEKPIEPVFCPDCGYKVRLSGNGVAEQLCTCHRWPTVILQSEPWPPEPKGTTTAGITSQLSENNGQMNALLIEALSYLQKFRCGHTLRDIDATQTDANKTLDALIQRMQDLTSHAANVKGQG
jgi:hypothetical protein